MIGNIQLAIKMPPAMKLTVAISEGNCRLDNPIMECPLVQPPAYRVPNPTSKPPPTIMRIPLVVSNDDQLKIASGSSPVSLVIPYPASSVASLGSTFKGAGFASHVMVIKPPATIPAAKKRFHTSFFQSYLKNEILAGKHEAHICRKDELIPNDLFPRMSNSGTISPINGPDTYQGHGCLKNSIIK